jgi:hypothetical protein
MVPVHFTVGNIGVPKGVSSEKKNIFAGAAGWDWPRMSAMQRASYGKMRSIPEATGAGDVGERTRWRCIRDGLGEVIRFMPPWERGFVSKLQQMWAYADMKTGEGLPEDESWPNLF